MAIMTMTKTKAIYKKPTRIVEGVDDHETSGEERSLGEAAREDGMMMKMIVPKGVDADQGRTLTNTTKSGDTSTGAKIVRGRARETESVDHAAEIEDETIMSTAGGRITTTDHEVETEIGDGAARGHLIHGDGPIGDKI